MISLLMTLMVDQVCSLQARGVCAAILSGNTKCEKCCWLPRGTSPKASLDCSLLLLAIVGNSRWKQMLLELPLCHLIVAVIVDEAEFIHMCPHTFSAHSLHERLHHCQIFNGVL